ncbi:MAG TPA: DNA polymerase III subunit delta [Legionellaceae bacterium]|nr:DNA polymerase III subunit delta [Legionellaceae bacterium]
MIIPYTALENHLKKQCAAVYLLSGSDPYLLQQAVLWIKQAWKKYTNESFEENIVPIQQSTDWSHGFDDANTYSLFAPYSLLDFRFDKKTLDTAAKQQIQTYLEHPNERCLVLIQAPLLSTKQIQPLVNHANIVHSHITPLTPQAFKKFIIQSLQNHGLPYESQEVPEIIYQYHQANLLACAQFITQLSLMHDAQQLLTPNTLMMYLRDQSEFTLYELGDSCLAAQMTKALHIFRQLHQTQTEPTLILWLLAQELRKLIQIHHLSQSMSFQAACQQLKIWSQKTALYQCAVQRLSLSKIYTLLKICQHLDEQIKSNRNKLIWNDLEQLIIKMLRT